MSSGVFLSISESYLIQIVDRFLLGKISRPEAALMLNKSERSVTRYAKKLREVGPAGIKHGNTGMPLKRKRPKRAA